jgi:DNA-binding Lrp family transcriptional regulator
MADPKEKKVARQTGPKKPMANFPKIERLPMPHEKLVRIVQEPEHSPFLVQPPGIIISSNERLDSQTSQAGGTSLDSQASLDSDHSLDRTLTSQVQESRLVPKTNQLKSSVDLMASLPDAKGFLKLYFQLIDYLYPQLDPFERAVHETLYRLSWGFGKPTCTISYQRIAERTNMSPKSAQRAAARLEQKGLVSKSSRIIGYNKEQGIEFSVVPPPRQVLETRQVRQTRLVPQTNMIETTTNIDTQTQMSGGVGSRFNLEECRRYADHLQATGQGIKNPGGYATTICRTGEADELIAAFLTPAQKPSIDQCPDCRGRGFYYPEHLGGETVEKCKHLRLNSAPSESQA